MTGTDEVVPEPALDDGEGASTTDPASAPDGGARWRRVGWAVAVVLAAIPALRMAGLVLDGSIMQHSDYWMMAQQFLTEDGSLDVAGLFHFQNEHPVVFAQLAYWVNTELFDGSNRTLGLYVVGLVVAQLVVLWRLLARSTFAPLEQMALLVTSSVLLFDLAGSWNFLKAMSGAAWLVANLFTLLAVLARSRDRRGWALAGAALAAMSYGTGAVAWFAVAATGACRRPVRELWREWPAAVGFLATLVWYRIAAVSGDPTQNAGVLRTVRAVAATFALPFGLEGHAAELFGLVPLVCVPVLVVWAWWSPGREGRAPWVGIAAYGWIAGILISYGRAGIYAVFGPQGRYTSLAALTWIALLALVVLAVRALADRRADQRSGDRRSGPAEPSRLRALVTGPVLVLVLAVPVVAGAASAGRDVADDLLSITTRQQAHEVAFHLGLVDGTSYVVGPLGAPVVVTERLRAAGHWPFVDGWDRDCGLLGETIDLPPPDQSAGMLLFGVIPSMLPDGVELVGAIAPGREVRCVVIVDGDGEVVGASGLAPGAAPDLAPPALRDGDGFTAVALGGREQYEAVVYFEDDPTPVRLRGQVRSDVLRQPG